MRWSSGEDDIEAAKLNRMSSAIPPVYTVVREDSTYYAEANLAGKTDYSGTVAATIIQNAIDGLTAGRTWKEKVVLKGNFADIHTPITIPSYTILEILGKLKLKDGANCDMFDNSDQTAGNSNIKVLGGELDGNKANQTGDSRAIHFDGTAVTDSIVAGMKIHDFKHVSAQYVALRMVNCTNMRILNNYVYDNDRGGLEFTYGSDNWAVNNRFKNNTLLGINLWDTEKAHIHHNTCEGGTFGIENYLTAHYCEITDNTCISQTDNGIVFRINSASKYNIVKGNTVITPANYGFHLMDSSYNDFSHNTVVAPTTWTPFYLDGMTYNKFHDNQVFGPFLAGNVSGFQLKAGANYNTFKNNLIDSINAHAYYGFRIEASANYNRIIHNDIYNYAGIMEDLGGTGTIEYLNTLDGVGVKPIPMVTGSYTGDAAATQAITGVGFQPTVLIVYLPNNSTYGNAYKTDQYGTKTHLPRGGGNNNVWEDDHIISLDADGFTVGDGTAGVGNILNINATDYYYIAWG